MAYWIEERSWLPKSKRLAFCLNLKNVKDAQLPAFITSYMKRKGIDVEPKATAMLADFVGADLSRLTGELEKSDHYTSKRSYTRYPRNR